MKNHTSLDILNSINEEYNSDLLSGSSLFDEYCNIEMDMLGDFADKWNSCVGSPDEVRRQRIELINPAVMAFVSKYKEDLKAHWDDFYDIMEDNNFHTPLFAIEKELQKYE